MPKNNLSAEDFAKEFAKAISINIDTRISKLAGSEENITNDIEKLMLEYTRKFVNEFAETAVIKMDDKEEASDKYTNAVPEDLEDTIPYMTSDQYQSRFKAEYYQLKIRIDKLQDMVDKWDRGELNFVPDNPRSTYNLQLRAMRDYLTILDMRAIIECIIL